MPQQQNSYWSKSTTPARTNSAPRDMETTQEYEENYQYFVSASHHFSDQDSIHGRFGVFYLPYDDGLDEKVLLRRYSCN